MTITVRWADDAHTIIYYEYVGKWTWEEYYRAGDEAVALAQTGNQRVSVIGDFRKSAFLPDAALSGFRRSLQTTRLEFDIVVLMFGSEFMQRLLDIFSRLYNVQKIKILTAHSLEEAIDTINAHRTNNSSTKSF